MSWLQILTKNQQPRIRICDRWSDEDHYVFLCFNSIVELLIIRSKLKRIMYIGCIILYINEKLFSFQRKIYKCKITKCLPIEWKIELVACIGGPQKYIMQIRVKENKQKIFHLKNDYYIANQYILLCKICKVISFLFLFFFFDFLFIEPVHIIAVDHQ